MVYKTIIIEGMSCEHCVSAVTKALDGINGVVGVTVDLKGGKAAVYTDGSVTDGTLREAVVEAGYEAAAITESK